jgi:hypothetical protein
MSKQQKDITNEIRCLRIHLSPVLSEHFKKVLQEAERRLAGEVSTTTGAPFKKTAKKSITKKELFNRLLSGKA